MIKKILIPFDGSEHANKALDYALELADKYSASITILTVLSLNRITKFLYPISTVEGPVIVAPIWIDMLIKEVRANNGRILSETLEKAKKAKPGLNISKKLVEGRPADKIVEMAKEEDFDIIVIGGRGLGDVTDILLGSVSDRVAHNAECPVLIVK